MNEPRDTTTAVKAEFAARRRREPVSLLDRFTTEAQARRLEEKCRTTISLDCRVLAEAKGVASSLGITVNDLILAGLDLVFRHQSRPSIADICKSTARPSMGSKCDEASGGAAQHAAGCGHLLSVDTAATLLPKKVT